MTCTSYRVQEGSSLQSEKKATDYVRQENDYSRLTGESFHGKIIQSTFQTFLPAGYILQAHLFFGM